MQSNETLNKLQEMQGKSFLYRNKKVLLNEIKVRGSIITFEFSHTDGKPLIVEKDYSQIDLFLLNLTHIDNIEIELQSTDENKEKENVNSNLPDKTHFEPQIYRDNRALFIQLRDGLIEDLNKVRKDKTYIPQAKQACNTANSIINLAKLELAMLRAE